MGVEEGERGGEGQDPRSGRCPWMGNGRGEWPRAVRMRRRIEARFIGRIDRNRNMGDSDPATWSTPWDQLRRRRRRTPKPRPARTAVPQRASDDGSGTMPLGRAMKSSTSVEFRSRRPELYAKPLLPPLI